MDMLFALLQSVLALFGLHAGGQTVVDRVSVDGRELLHSEVRVADGVARFDCLRSSSGRCHYTLLAPGCAPAASAAQRDCQRLPLRRLVVARGASTQVAGVTDVRFCVSASAGDADGDCAPRPPRR